MKEEEIENLRLRLIDLEAEIVQLRLNEREASQRVSYVSEDAAANVVKSGPVETNLLAAIDPALSAAVDEIVLERDPRYEIS